MLRLKTAAHVRLVKGSHVVVRRLYEHDRAYIFQSADGRVAATEGFERGVRALQVGGEIVVGQVVDEEVEAVPRDEPAPDRGGVGIDRAMGAAEDGQRCTRRIGFEEVVEEEALRTVSGDRDRRQRR